MDLVFSIFIICSFILFIATFDSSSFLIKLEHISIIRIGLLFIFSFSILGFIAVLKQPLKLLETTTLKSDSISIGYDSIQFPSTIKSITVKTYVKPNTILFPKFRTYIIEKE